MRQRCDCGRRARVDGICARCATLDGEDLPLIGRTLIAELRRLTDLIAVGQNATPT